MRSMSERGQRLAGNKAVAVCGRSAATVAGVRARETKTAEGEARVGRTEEGLHPAAFPAFYWSSRFCQLPGGRPAAFASLEEPHIVSARSKRTLSCGLKSRASFHVRGVPSGIVDASLGRVEPRIRRTVREISSHSECSPSRRLPNQPTALADHFPFNGGR